MKLTDLALDINKDKTGVDFDFGDGFVIWIARARNKKHDDAQERYMKPHRVKIQRGIELPSDLSNKLLGLIAADGLVRNWTGLEDEDGNPIEYSPETARELLCDPKFSHLRDQIIAIANDAKLFYEKSQSAEEDLLKK